MFTIDAYDKGSRSQYMCVYISESSILDSGVNMFENFPKSKSHMEKELAKRGLT